MIIPAVSAVGVSDAGNGINPFLPGAGWDVVFEAPLWNTQVNEAEIYQIHLDGPVGAQAMMLLNGKPWNHILQGWANYDDPAQPAILDQGMTVQFCWSVAFRAGPYTASGGSNVLPAVTIWLRTRTPQYASG